MPFRKIILLTISTLVLFIFTLQAHAGVLYVKPGGTGNGTSWANAFGDPQEAIETAAVDDDYSQVWVTAGTYLPTGHPNGGFRAREVHFSLRNGVSVYGGFLGTETSLSERNFETNETIFSGDIGVEGDDSDNAYHVFYHPEGTNLDETAVLDGVTIVGGNANGDNWPYISGGAIFNDHCNPSLINLNIKNNKSNFFIAFPLGGNGGVIRNQNSNPILTNVFIENNIGGGIYNDRSNPFLTNVKLTNNKDDGLINHYSHPTLSNVIINNNQGIGIRNSDSNPRLYRVTIVGNSLAGIYNSRSDPTLNDVYISSNSGGISNYNSDPTLNNATITNNTQNYGGAIFNNESSPIIINATISDNSALEGGGIYNSKNSNPIIINSTITNNSAAYGGGVLNEDSNPQIKNSILWNNSATESGDEYINAGTSSPQVSWSIVQGGYEDGVNIITDDPLLQPLTNNGGFTQTHAIPSDSPAYAIPQSEGGGNWNDAPDKDQRGMPRATSGSRAIGAYEDAFGSLRVVIDSTEAVQAGAQWRIQGAQTWYDSGETASEILIGTYTIEFSTVPGWRPEGTITVTVEADKTVSATGYYVEQEPGLPGVLMLLLDD